MSITTLVAVGGEVEIDGEPGARYPIFSVTKTAGRRRRAPAGGGRRRRARLGEEASRPHERRARHGSLAEYDEAVRTQPGSAWDDDEFLARTDAADER